MDGKFTSALAKDLESVEVELRVELGKTVMTFSKMMDLKVGDLMILEASEASPLPVYIQGRRKLQGAPRVAGGSLAVVLDNGLAAPTPSAHQPFPIAANGG